MVDATKLTITRPIPLSHFPPYGVLTTVKICSDALLYDISHPARSDRLYISFANITSLTITHFSESSARLFDEVLEGLFQFLQSLFGLDHLEIDEFALRDTQNPPDIPSSVSQTPLSVRDVVITRTQGTSLSFLLGCLRPRDLTLISCAAIDTLPDCASLTLIDIRDFGPADALFRWKGPELIIQNCRFFERFFLRELRHMVIVNQQMIWLNTRVSVQPHTDAIWRRVEELRGIRLS
ncbi:hypothetical protein NMY22_g10535 [Coprinellus aureogranulatus]|nr:hypothetical protein NMY22_g10535 [Coprinellus aureogranulatus]